MDHAHHRRLSGSLGGLLILPLSEQALEVLAHQRLRSGQIPAPRDGQCQLQVAQLLADEGHHR